MKPYINMNTKLRTEARNDFEIGFPKLNNLVFVKTVENIRKHIYIYIYIYIYIHIYIYTYIYVYIYIYIYIYIY